MFIKAFGYYLTPQRFLRVCFWRIFCTHKTATFHASTCAEKYDSVNVKVGVTFVCERCRRAWAGDIIAGGDVEIQYFFLLGNK